MPEERSAGAALVTGAVGGLGQACCAALAATGAHVVVADLDESAAAELAARLVANGGSASGVALDVRDPAAVERVVAAAVERSGSLDVVVNLAGTLRNQLLAKIDDDDFELVQATHVKGTLHTMRAAVPSMRANGYGRIVNMSSLAARGSIAGSAYGAAKGAIEGLTRSAAMELARHGITANCVSPGLMRAGMFLTVDPEYQETMAKRIPMGRLGDPEEVAACVTFLASPQSAYVTGQTLMVCGGLSLGF
jgi:3-oxoacyl-[acyl-carrier protein] reductase